MHHFLLVCQKYERLRDEMRKKVGVGGMKMEKLLGDPRRIVRGRGSQGAQRTMWEIRGNEG